MREYSDAEIAENRRQAAISVLALHVKAGIIHKDALRRLAEAKRRGDEVGVSIAKFTAALSAPLPKSGRRTTQEDDQ